MITTCGPEARSGCVGDSAARLVDVEHPGADGSDGSARRQTLNDPRHNKGGQAVGVDEHDQSQYLADDAGYQHGTPSNVIGEASDD